ncbi:MAG: hypothetical protein NT047_09345 [Deltaproteobacteria bacterium]|nr:hypothetical protein [Deltaproteobacteria bacterium]
MRAYEEGTSVEGDHSGCRYYFLITYDSIKGEKTDQGRWRFKDENVAVVEKGEVIKKNIDPTDI